MRYLSHTKEDLEGMLCHIGKHSIEELFDSIPKSIRLQKPLSLPVSACELEIKKELTRYAGLPPKRSFLGAGVTPHFVPELVNQMLLRGEWYTAYTPYQPEVSQGTLQAAFEFQSMVCGLFGCEVANSSMYDGPSAFAEALLMAVRCRPGSDKVVFSQSIHPEYRSVAKTFLGEAGIAWDEIPLSFDGTAKGDPIATTLNQPGIAAIAYQTPNFFWFVRRSANLDPMGASGWCTLDLCVSRTSCFWPFTIPWVFGSRCGGW